MYSDFVLLPYKYVALFYILFVLAVLNLEIVHLKQHRTFRGNQI